MRGAEIATRALLGLSGLHLNPLDTEVAVSPNPARHFARQVDGCDPGWTSCTSDGCMPIGHVCCTSYVPPHKAVPGPQTCF